MDTRKEVCSSREDPPLDTCSGLNDYEVSNGFCSSSEVRLCTFDELNNNQGYGKGCGYDKKFVWSSTPCDLDNNVIGVIVVNSHTMESNCVPKTNSYGTTCCADSAYVCIDGVRVGFHQMNTDTPTSSPALVFINPTSMPVITSSSPTTQIVNPTSMPVVTPPLPTTQIVNPTSSQIVNPTSMPIVMPPLPTTQIENPTSMPLVTSSSQIVNPTSMPIVTPPLPTTQIVNPTSSQIVNPTSMPIVMLPLPTTQIVNPTSMPVPPTVPSQIFSLSPTLSVPTVEYPHPTIQFDFQFSDVSGDVDNLVVGNSDSPQTTTQIRPISTTYYVGGWVVGLFVACYGLIMCRRTMFKTNHSLFDPDLDPRPYMAAKRGRRRGQLDFLARAAGSTSDDRSSLLSSNSESETESDDDDDKFNRL
jgi:hypothetical protein